MTEDAFERAARRDQRNAQARAGFRIHLAIYLAVNAMLVVIWAVTPHAHETIPWFLWPAMGWGIGIVAHFASVRGWIATSGHDSGRT
jgi:hypothetical protein